MKYILNLLGVIAVLFCSVNTEAQIIAPDSICLGTSINFNSAKPAVTYHWDFNNVNVIQPPSPTTLVASGFNIPSWSCFMKDGPNYYLFVSSYNTGNIIRLNYGTSLYSTPVITNLGTLGGTAINTECMDLAKDSLTGDWYGLLVNNSQLIVVSFGSSLSNTPTFSMTPYPQLVWAHQITIKRWHGNWHAFVANRNAGIARFDFGSALTNPPTVTSIPNVGGVANPCNFSLYEQSGNWYMLITNLINATVSRYSFGANLLNNAPTGTLLPAPAGMLNLPRPVFILNDCHNNLIAYVVNETGNLIRLNFAGDITNMPVFTNMGPTGVTSVASGATCAYADSFYYLLPNFSAGTVSKFRPLDFTPPTFLQYFNGLLPWTFTTTGPHDVSLFLDMGRPSGPSVGCKRVTVVNVSPITGSHTLCVGGSTTLSNATAGGTWTATPPTVVTINATTGTVTAVGAGTATITYTAPGGCTATFTMTINPSAPIAGNTPLCVGAGITLTNPVTGGTWVSSSPGVATVNAGGVVTGVASGTSVITYTATGGCLSTVVVTVLPTPPITVPPALCIGSTGTATSTTLGGLWSSSTPAVAVIDPTTGLITALTAGTTTITYNTGVGCPAVRVVSVVAVAPISGGPLLCVGHSIVLSSSIPGGVWSSGTPVVATITATGSVTGLAPGTTTISYSLGSCSSSTIITVTAVPAISSSITQLCTGSAVALAATPVGGTWTSSNTGVATVGVGTGVVTGITPGTTTLSYTMTAGCFATSTITINLNPAAIASPGILCQTRSTYLSATVSGGTWTSANATIATVGATDGYITGINTGTTFVTYTVSPGCYQTAIVTVNPIPLPPATAPLHYCQGAAATGPLTATGTNLVWYTSATGGFGNTTPPIPPTSIPGIHTWYVSQLQGGCESDRTPLNVTIHPTPVLNIAREDTSLCVYDTVTLWATGTTFSGIQYSWSVPGHALITAGNLNTPAVQLVFNDSKYGNMIVLTAGDGYAPCDVSDTEYVKIDTNMPEAHFYVKPYICPNEEVEVALISRSNKVADYVWNFDGGTIITKNSNNGGPYKIAWNQPGKHIVTVIAKSEGACPDYLAADTVQVVNPDARIDSIPATLCAGDSVEFRPKVYDAANNYTWAPDHYFVQNNSYSIWGKIDRAGFVTLTVTDPYGCTATEKVMVNAQPCCEVALPNAFTPNGDGKNDRFRPITSGHHVIHVFRVKNRWGQTMFDSGHEPLGWDGTLNGEPQDMGTYFYYLRYDCEGVSKEMKGDVTLVR